MMIDASPFHWHRHLLIALAWATCFAPALVPAAPQRIVGYLPRSPIDYSQQVGGGVMIWEIGQDRYYTAFESLDLSVESWTPLVGHPLAGTGDPVTLPYNPGLDRCFYRLGVSLTDDPITP